MKAQSLRACLAALAAMVALAALVRYEKVRRTALFYVPVEGSVTAGVGGLLASIDQLGRKTKSLGEGTADWSEHVGTYKNTVTRTLRALRAESKRIDFDVQSDTAFMDTPGPQGPPGWMGWTGKRGETGRQGATGLAGHRGAEGLSGSECVRTRRVFLTSLVGGVMFTTGTLSPGVPGKEGLEGRVGGTGSAGSPGMQGPMGVEGELCAPAFLRARECSSPACFLAHARVWLVACASTPSASASFRIIAFRADGGCARPQATGGGAVRQGLSARRAF